MGERIQAPRDARWKPPPGVVLVSRATPWGNPWIITPTLEVDTDTGQPVPGSWVFKIHNGDTGHYERTERTAAGAHALAAKRYEEQTLAARLESRELDLEPLRGKTIACYCPPRVACHGDVLLAYAAEPDPLGRVYELRAARTPAYVANQIRRSRPR